MTALAKPPVIVLLAVWLLLALSLTFGACRAQSPPDDGVEWSSFTTVDGPGLTRSNLDDLSRKAGFRFVLPSYLSAGVGRTFLLSSQIEVSSEGQGVVSLMWDDKAPRDIQMAIQIDEYLRPPWHPRTTGNCQVGDDKIGGICVHCSIEVPNETWPTPTPNEGYPAGLTCDWATEQLVFYVAFGWQTESGATPEVTPDRRDEAMKVVASMIQDPYIP